MSEIDSGASEISEPTVEPKVYSSSSKSSYKRASSVKAEIIPDTLPDEMLLKVRVSLQEDHGFAGNEMPTSDSATISAWAAIVTKTGTFADALKALGE
tara:strand:- start:992 stop:1285 length:294 start_codon:yes stop_codon:yes gene_type:complete